MLAQVLLTVLYTQITVAIPGTPVGGLLWTDDHVAQGFAWSPGFVRFGVPDHEGQVRLTVALSQDFRPDAGTLWAVQTPLEVNEGQFTVGTIGDEHIVSVPPGRYDLVFEARASTDDDAVDYDLRLHLIETSMPSFGVLKQGEELEADRVLSTVADPV